MFANTNEVLRGKRQNLGFLCYEKKIPFVGDTEFLFLKSEHGIFQFFHTTTFFPLEEIWNIPNFSSTFSKLLEHGIFQTKTAATKLSKIL